ncbi:MAG: desulfoferrodoxin [Lachnospiraceae bacterium]|nr:desulfoferrodoxin [Lachnospiraceae bacterium]
MKQKFLICEHCKNIVAMVQDKGVPVMCCGQKMTELIPGTSDGATEKHVPVYTVDGSTVHVTVGDVEHPMLPEHYIQWIALETTNGSQIKELQPGQPPKADFVLAEGESVVAVYEYCNLHSLWKA